MTETEVKVTIEYLKEVQEKYIEGNGYERHPLPEWYALDIAIKALEKEPCDCISREEALKALGEAPYVWADCDAELQAYEDWRIIKEMLEGLPSISPLEPKAGHWQKYKSMIYCSECGASIEAGYLNDMNYCYNCGARMNELAYEEGE